MNAITEWKNLFIYLFIFVFCPFRAAPAACGGSQARGPVGATTAASLRQSHSNARSEPCLPPTPQPRWILNLLNKARDRTCNLMVPGGICFHCATTELLKFKFLNCLLGNLWPVAMFETLLCILIFCASFAFLSFYWGHYYECKLMLQWI